MNRENDQKYDCSNKVYVGNNDWDASFMKQNYYKNKDMLMLKYNFN